MDIDTGRTRPTPVRRAARLAAWCACLAWAVLFVISAVGEFGRGMALTSNGVRIGDLGPFAVVAVAVELGMVVAASVAATAVWVAVALLMRPKARGGVSGALAFAGVGDVLALLVIAVTVGEFRLMAIVPLAVGVTATVALVYLASRPVTTAPAEQS